MPFIKIGPAAALPPGSLAEALIDDQPYAICNLNGELHALEGTCPHAGGPLGHGNLIDNLIYCPWHDWAFDCRTGENSYDPNLRLDCFPIKAENGEIFLDPSA